MKKLMFVAATALCGSLFAGTEITSANVVGYDNLDLAKQKELRGVNFFAVGGEGVDIQKIIPYDGDAIAADDFKTWWWNPNKVEGNIIGNEYAVRRGYYWDPEDPQAEEGYVFLDPEGTNPSVWVWTTMDDDQPIKWEKKFSAGTGFFTQPGCVDPKLTVSGEVLQPVGNVAYFKIELGKQKQLVASPFPVAVALQNIVPFDGDDIAADDFKTWWWNPNKVEGNIIGNEYAVRRGYYWDPEDPQAEEGYVFLDPEGTNPSVWVWTTTDDDQPIKWEKTFAAGEGFFTQPGCTEPKLAFPNPFYVAE